MADKPEGEQTPETKSPEGETKAPEGNGPEGTTPQPKPEDTKAPQTPQTPASEPPTPPVTKETETTPPASQTAAQGDDEAAKVKAEADAAKTEAANLKVELERERAARKYNIPDELIPMLRAGSVEADAKALSTHAGRGSSLGTGGLDPTDTNDPKAEGKRLADRLFAKSRRF